MKVNFKRNDGVEDVAYISTTKTSLGYRGYVKIGVIRSCVTDNMETQRDAMKLASDGVKYYGENVL